MSPRLNCSQHTITHFFHEFWNSLFVYYKFINLFDWRSTLISAEINELLHSKHYHLNNDQLCNPPLLLYTQICKSRPHNRLLLFFWNVFVFFLHLRFEYVWHTHKICGTCNTITYDKYLIIIFLFWVLLPLLSYEMHCN